MTRSREENIARLRDAHREIAPGQQFEIKDFRPEDAHGVAALFYAAYGETFPVDYVYSPERIIQAHASGQLFPVVGRTKSGEILGMHAYFRNPPGQRIMEIGLWVVLPAYRHTTLAMRLAQRTLGAPPTHLGVRVVHTQNVCDHLISQKAAEKYKFLSCALELDAMPPRPEDAQQGSGRRISLIDAFMVLEDSPHEVRLPAVYAGALRRMYASRGLRREFSNDGQPQAETRCSAQSMDAASLAALTADVVGRDFAARLARFEQEYPERDHAQLILPLGRPGVSLAVEAARNAGYFLGGLLLVWDDEDMLLMQKLRTPPDYSRIKLHTQEAKELLELVAADRASLNA